MLKKFELVNEDNAASLYDRLNKRSQNRLDVTDKVTDIIEQVRKNGDTAIREYTLKFDRVNMENISVKVTKKEMERAKNNVCEDIKEIIKQSAFNIRNFHEKQKRNSWFNTDSHGNILGQLINPIEQIGVYVPGGVGGSVPLISSVLMNIIPAKLAGVNRIVMVTPPGEGGKINDKMLYAADIAGADEIYKIGGAQAIAAMAYGTKSIEPVDKIFGPGNIYVATAKRLVFGKCGIDQFAGPSEILVVADKYANPKFVAADLLSQAEHDKMAAAILITDSLKFADKVNENIKILLKQLNKSDICKSSLKEYGCSAIVNNMNEAVNVANKIAPEHLELYTQKPFDLLPKIKNAGAIFLGENSSEPVGDYFAGPNHVLPTNGTAKFSSPLSVDDFTKKSSIISYSKKALKDTGDKIIDFALAENLQAHANAIKVRMEELNQ